MSRLVNDQEFFSVLKLTAEARYQHWVKHVVDTQEIWSLFTPGEGWRLLGDKESQEYVPVWPHPRYAAAYAESVFPGSEPKSIPLDEWMKRWIPGMSKDKRKTVVFPTPTSNGVIASLPRLKKDLEREMDEYE